MSADDADNLQYRDLCSRFYPAITPDPWQGTVGYLAAGVDVMDHRGRLIPGRYPAGTPVLVGEARRDTDGITRAHSCLTPDGREHEWFDARWSITPPVVSPVESEGR